MTKDSANKIYDVLVKYAGAHEDWRNNFVYCHAVDKYGCQEYRFQGDLGFGGKYYSGRNKVSAYSEDLTPKREKQIDKVNYYLLRAETSK